MSSIQPSNSCSSSSTSGADGVKKTPSAMAHKMAWATLSQTSMNLFEQNPVFQFGDSTATKISQVQVTHGLFGSGGPHNQLALHFDQALSVQPTYSAKNVKNACQKAVTAFVRTIQPRLKELIQQHNAAFHPDFEIEPLYQQVWNNYDWTKFTISIDGLRNSISACTQKLQSPLIQLVADYALEHTFELPVSPITDYFFMTLPFSPETVTQQALTQNQKRKPSISPQDERRSREKIFESVRAIYEMVCLNKFWWMKDDLQGVKEAVEKRLLIPDWPATFRIPESTVIALDQGHSWPLQLSEGLLLDTETGKEIVFDIEIFKEFLNISV